LTGGFAAPGVEAVGEDVVGEVRLAGAEGAFVDAGIGDGEEFDGFDAARGCGGVAGVLGDEDVLVGFPLGQDERTVADEGAGLGPAGAAGVGCAGFKDGGGVDGEPGLVRGEGEQVGCGAGEGELERAGVEGLGADLGEIGEFAGGVVGGAGEDVEHVGVVGGELGVEDALDGEHEVLGGDGVAVGPEAVGSEVERVGETVGGDIPAGGGAGEGP